MAEYFESVQWAVRPVTAHRFEEHLGEELPVNCGPITEVEVRRAAKRLKNNRACGLDNVPAEFWKALFCTAGPAATWATEFCKLCWEGKAVPESWHMSRVMAIFKKGDPAQCENYRPISLSTVGYKLFATVLLQRLKDAGAEGRIWPTQFGFKSNSGTSDALFLARRLIEEACESKGGSAVLLALDWAKAFDSLDPSALKRALVRFGIPRPFVDMVNGIYSDRRFVVQDGGARSSPHHQHFGICQGCPMSPFLFVMVMTVLIRDAKQLFIGERGGVLDPSLVVHELLYADDTLLMDASGGSVEQYMRCVEEVGAEFGLTFNFSKLESMPVRCADVVQSPGGGEIPTKSSMVYLGGLISNDGKIDSELARRIGMAKSDFRSLQKVWGHAGLPCKRKLEIYTACVVNTLLYNLNTTWLSAAARRRINGFHARCLRQILHIPPAFISHVSNEVVLRMAGAQPLSEVLLRQQLSYFGRIARMPDGAAIRQVVFEPGTLQLKSAGPRRRGRPRISWAGAVRQHAVTAAGGEQQLQDVCAREDTPQAQRVWAATVRRYLSARASQGCV